MIGFGDLVAGANRLAPHYSRFRVSERLLLTGHSHQAWPDRAERGHRQAFEDAAERVDGKWDRAFERADRVRRGFAERLGDGVGHITLSASTHDLLVRLLSAFDLRSRPRLVTTDGEFHTVDRQLRRLAEEGVEVIRVPARPVLEIGPRLAAAVDDRTAAVLVSTVFFETAEIAGPLGAAADACRLHGAALVLDTYHQLNVVPMALERDGLGDAFVVGGGYKYCQLGEGNCFLRTPGDCSLRPVITGWFSSFDELEDADRTGPVAYGDGHRRFAGATYEPTSHYRAAEVFDFFDELDLAPDLLRRVSQHQIGRLRVLFDGLDLDPRVIDRDRDLPLDRVAGFLAMSSPVAGEIRRGLLDRGVLSDCRRGVLRFGPAPYVADGQLEEAIGCLGEVVRSLRKGPR